jgi:uncharacterized phiE125 gp8 family phage protein
VANPHWAQAGPLLKVSSAPTSLITLADAKEHLEIDHSDRDSMIASLVSAASQLLDGYDGMIGKAVAEQTVTYSIKVGSNWIELPVSPVKSLLSVSYFDENNASQTIDATNFRLVGNEDFACLEAVDEFSWPTTYDRADAITFTLLCGFSEVPDAIGHACKLIVGHWFEHREAASEQSIQSIQWAVESLCGKYRKGWIAA